MEEELNRALKKIKNRKVVRIDEISTEIGKTRKFDDVSLK